MANNLTQEFWSKLAEKYAGEISVFRNWIDEYKKRIGWEKLFHPQFNFVIVKASGLSAPEFIAPKFHDLPDAMQAGLFMQYVLETKGAHRYSIVFDTEQMHLGEKSSSSSTFSEIIEEWFCQEHSNALQDHQEAKYHEE